MKTHRIPSTYHSSFVFSPLLFLKQCLETLPTNVWPLIFQIGLARDPPDLPALQNLDCRRSWVSASKHLHLLDTRDETKQLTMSELFARTLRRFIFATSCPPRTPRSSSGMPSVLTRHALETWPRPGPTGSTPRITNATSQRPC